MACTCTPRHAHLCGSPSTLAPALPRRRRRHRDDERLRAEAAPTRVPDGPHRLGRLRRGGRRQRRRPGWRIRAALEEGGAEAPLGRAPADLPVAEQPAPEEVVAGLCSEEATVREGRRPVEVQRPPVEPAELGAAGLS